VDTQQRSPLVTALLLAPAGILFFFLLILPLIVMLVFSFGERAAAGGYAAGFTFDNYLNLPARSKAFINTLTLAPLGTLLTAIIAFPMAYFLAVKVPPKWRWSWPHSGPANSCVIMHGS
jgi:spermidine/putrescine transport system permease protein